MTADEKPPPQRDSPYHGDSAGIKRISGVVCPSCSGRGICMTCDGSGLWYEGSFREQRCDVCEGRGACPRCMP